MSILSFLFGNSVDTDKVSILTKPEFAKAITGKKVQLVDVRTAKEFNSGHIKGAKNLDFFSSSAFTAGFENMKKDDPVYIYCQSGNRSQKAARKLVNMGFEQIFDLQGGYGNWRR